MDKIIKIKAALQFTNNIRKVPLLVKYYLIKFDDIKRSNLREFANVGRFCEKQITK